jgi:hypothetical protein
MARLAWAADLHFEFATVADVVGFCERVIALDVDRLLVAGDIAQARSIGRYLRALDRALPMPVDFVLGNHDFYHGSIRDVREAVATVVRQSAHLTWLPCAGVIPIDERTALVGHDGWADGRCGDYEASRVRLNDYRLIRELTGMTPAARRPILAALGDEAAAHFEHVLPTALAQAARVIVVTHVPPFPEAAWYRGRISDPEYLPHFCAGAVGTVLRGMMERHPDRQMLVLCGHTHTGGTVQVLPNLTVSVATAEYGKPGLQGVIETGNGAVTR